MTARYKQNKVRCIKKMHDFTKWWFQPFAKSGSKLFFIREIRNEKFGKNYEEIWVNNRYNRELKKVK